MGIRSRIFLIVFLLLTVSIAITYVVAERDLTRTFKLQIVDELEKQANLLVASVDNLNKFSNINDADNAANELGKASNSRVTFITNNGDVIGDSQLDIEQISSLDNHASREEFVDALKNGNGWSSRYSNTLNQDLLYFAIKDNQEINPNIIRVAVPLNYLDKITDTLGLSVILLFAVVFIVSIIASGVAANFLYSNIQDLAEAANSISKGVLKNDNLKALPTQRVDEFGTVARSISQISEDLKNQIKMIAKQRDQFGLVLDDLGEGIIVTNKKGDVVFTNEQASVILHIEDLSNTNIKKLDIPALNYLFKRVKNKKSADIEFEIEIDNKNTQWVLGSMNQSKTTGEFILVVHDITQLRQLNSMRRDFISNLSHELRTPVSVIRANSETLLDGALDNKKDAKVFAKAILHNSERLSLMVSDLIDLSRIEYGEVKLNFEPVNINRSILGALDSIKGLAAKKEISLFFDEHDDTYVWVDTNAIERILINLLDNAIKYSPQKSSVTVKVLNDTKHLEINVIDSGKGIDDMDKKRIFGRFYRTAQARASDKTGSGLGLAIVKNLAHSLNGDVGVKNSDSGGCNFWFTVPKAK